MQPLSEQLAELSVQARKAEDRVAKAQSEVKERLEHQRDEAHREAEAAFNRVKEHVARAGEVSQLTRRLGLVPPGRKMASGK